VLRQAAGQSRNLGPLDPPSTISLNVMRVEAKMRRHCLDCIVGRIGVHGPLLAGIGFILDPRRFDQPKWHSCLASR
jgi:hypothetical protein